MNNGGSTYNFYNTCVKYFSGDHAMIRSNPLSGYQLYQNESKTSDELSAFPTNHGQENKFMSWKNLNISQKNRMKDCTWSDNTCPFNTQIMREQSTVGENAILHLNLVKAHISSNNLISEMNAEEIYHLTPNETETIVCPLDTQHPLLQLVLNKYNVLNDKIESLDIINPKYISNGNIHLPKEIVHLCLE